MAKKIEAENSIDTTKNEEIKEAKKKVEKKSTKAKSSTKKSTTTESTKKKQTSTTNKSTTAKSRKTTTKNEATESDKKDNKKVESEKIEEKEDVKANSNKNAKKSTTSKKDTSKKLKKEKKEEKPKEEVKVNEEEENLEEVAVASKEEAVEIEEIKKTIKKKKIVPKEEIEKINKSLFKNIIVAICVIIYFIFLNLGQMNIKGDVYVTDLKVFSMCVLLTAIALLEVAYKKDSGEIALYGVEMIVISLTTVALIYVNLMLSTRYVYIVSAISYIFAIYYLIKSIVIFLRKKKQYFVNNMKEIMNKDE